jgi:hypothetical protein
MNKFRVYTGPTLSEPVAWYLQDHFNTVTAGTEHVYVLTTKTGEDVLATLKAKYSGFTYRDVQAL